MSQLKILTNNVADIATITVANNVADTATITVANTAAGMGALRLLIHNLYI